LTGVVLAFQFPEFSDASGGTGAGQRLLKLQGEIPFWGDHMYAIERLAR
jgi:hypothetical protein